MASEFTNKIVYLQVAYIVTINHIITSFKVLNVITACIEDRLKDTKSVAISNQVLSHEICWSAFSLFLARNPCS